MSTDVMFDYKLLRQKIGSTRRHRSIKPLYGDKQWAQDLDIVNELGGHTGCVNALSWSTDGALLASGSDDKYLNIWSYNPANLATPFTLNTSVSTGHRSNIFSVKFMPHSNDSTLVTCAGDCEVRVFDIEYSGAAANVAADTSFASSTRSRRFNTFFGNARWLSEYNTNARVYRSHTDRAKRIVTESSPHLFLTCSEDGEVRQWDLRQPSSFYPPVRGGRTYARLASASAGEEDYQDAPPPLISYKRYGLDLNTISCAGSQPHYIALGGAHLHCFLHDRRMLGRDLDNERGQAYRKRPTAGSREDGEMHTATRCVRRFAPHNKRRMSTRDRSHITSCKISNANPNEMIASWSGDHIYSFDIIKSPGARDADRRQDEAFQATRTKMHDARKRKRAVPSTSTNGRGDGSASSRTLRRVPDEQLEQGRTALRVRYENGETENIPLETNGDANVQNAVTPDNLLTEAQRLSKRIAQSLVKLRKTLFSFASAMQDETAISMESSEELTPHTAAFTNVLGQCTALLPQMDEVIRNWTYPVNPTEEDVSLQKTMRKNRQASWRFVQAAGCMARIMGGKLQTLSEGTDPRLIQFNHIRPAAREGRAIWKETRFSLDFLKAILAWVDGGRAAVLQAFVKPVGLGDESLRYPLDKSDTVHTLVQKLQTYLMDLADEDKPIINVDANRFEVDGNRVVFESQTAAVNAFIRALSGIRLELKHGLSTGSTAASSSTVGGDTTTRVMDKGAAARFWGVKVGRSLLMEAAEGITFDFVVRAFGGLRVHIVPDDGDEPERSQEDIDPEETERIIEAIDLITSGPSLDTEDQLLLTTTETPSSSSGPSAVTAPENGVSADVEMSSDHENGDFMSASEHNDVDVELVEETMDGQAAESVHASEYQIDSGVMEVEEVDDEDGGEDEDDDDDDDESGNNEEHDDDDDSDEDDDQADANPLFTRRIGFNRSRDRASVNPDVPYSSHTKVYKGHCNTRTVKDVNYYGLDDEYVVSGSDDGHFFIWDRKTMEIVNILEGDGEVVNVVQGHPYEPMIACSGIDSTVKIFGVAGDNRERDAAERGYDIANPSGGIHSSLRIGGRRRARASDLAEEDEASGTTAGVSDESDRQTSTGLKSRKAMHKCYEITSQNDVERRRGLDEAFMTEGMLARIAAALQGGQIQPGSLGLGATGGTIVVDDNCSVM